MNDDIDIIETREWLESIRSVIESSGNERAGFLLQRLANYTRDKYGIELLQSLTTPYRNTIPLKEQQPLPGDIFIERRIRSLVRWNALAMVMRSNIEDESLGGHIATYSSASTLYEVGFNHFFRGYDDGNLGDLILFQGHSSPGIYARSFLEGRITEKQLMNFRREVDGKGLASYPHPWLMPNYWQFPTVSMGLGPLQAIYLAHIMNYQSKRNLVDNKGRKVWAFLGDGECDEPESLGAISMAGREQLDNLIFVVNCNLQRLDGPVRGNSKIIQELEGIFRGAGWNVIKVIWGNGWDALFEKDVNGRLQSTLESICDGDYQNFKNNGGSYTRKHLFGTHPELLKMVENMSDADIEKLNRGGHDSYKVYAAYYKAVSTKGQPTVILAKTIKGYGMGEAAESSNVAHSVKKLDLSGLKHFRDRFNIPIGDDALSELPFYKPADDSAEMQYLLRRRKQLKGFIPTRLKNEQPLEIPPIESSIFKPHLEGSGERNISTTMAFVRIISALTKDKSIGSRIVPIVPDEARTFGMEGMFRQLGIYSSEGQKYVPHDSGKIMYYKESEDGQILEEGINEAGAFSAWMAAATSYSHTLYPMIPFYIFYSMFGFQRIGDLAWSAGDSRAKGFLIGATSGRTTLNGEGLQHQDGHGHLLANVIPNCISYDPTYAYELAIIIQHGAQRMYVDGDCCFYYLSTMNENYAHPPQPANSSEGIVRGIYLLREADNQDQPRAQLLGSGSILLEVEAAAQILQQDWGIGADIWSVTSINELSRDGVEVERWNMLHPEEKPRVPYVTKQLQDRKGPAIIATDYIKSYSQILATYIPMKYKVLGTDGFGRSDTRIKLREHFEVSRYYVVVMTLKALSELNEIPTSSVGKAIQKYNIYTDKLNPRLL